MRNFVTVAAFAAGANALVSRDTSCCFHITASGEASGPVGQLGDGQNRIGGGLPEGQFCIDSDGSITDGSGRGCILTPPTTQFQCDLGGTPTPGFSVNTNGQLEYNGQTNFVACQTGDNNALNIYTNPNSGDVTSCVSVQLAADSCAGSGSGTGSSSIPVYPSTSTPLPSSTVPVVSPSPSVPGGGVPVSPSPSGPGSEGPPGFPGTCAGCAPTTTVYTTVTADCGYGTPTAPTGGGETPTAPAGGGETPTSPVGGGETPTSPVGGGQTPTGPVGGGQTPTGPVGGGETPTTPAGTPSQPPSTSAPQPQPSSSGGNCPADLSGNYETPHLIIPVDSSSPDYAPGTSYNGSVTSTISTIFNFDIPASDAGKTCSLVFLFPKQEDLETSAFSFSGDGKVQFGALESPAQQDTSYNTAPAVAHDYGVFTVAPGNAYVISTVECPAGQSVGFEMTNSGSTNLDFFEDWNPSPIGLFITVC
ncbi:ubiquitin 3 binding protein But2 C-terminal domain-containing protein [Aspergillus varians]